MTVPMTRLEYRDGDTLCRGFYMKPENAPGPLPLVLGAVDASETIPAAGRLATAFLRPHPARLHPPRYQPARRGGHVQPGCTLSLPAGHAGIVRRGSLRP